MTSPSIEIKQHCQKLSTEETDEVIEAIADLIVSYLVGRGRKTHERDDEQSEG